MGGLTVLQIYFTVIERFGWSWIDAEAFGGKVCCTSYVEICGWSRDSMDLHFWERPLGTDVFHVYSGVRVVSECGGDPEGKR